MQQKYKELLLGSLNASNDEITLQNLLKGTQKERQVFKYAISQSFNDHKRLEQLK
jgi:hypothetical protein